MKHIRYFIIGTIATLLFTGLLVGIARLISFLGLDTFMVYVIVPIAMIAGFYTVGKLFTEEYDKRKHKSQYDSRGDLPAN